MGFSISFRQSFINILGGKQIYKPVHEDIDRLLLLCWVFQLSRTECSRERSYMLHIKTPIDKRLTCLFNEPCHARPYRLTLPLSFFEAGRLQLQQTLALCFSMSLVAASALVSAVLRPALIIYQKLEERR